MTNLNFYELGFSFLNVDDIVDEAIKHIEAAELDKDVILNLHACFPSYDFSRVFDALVNNLSSSFDTITITIKYSFREAYEGEMLNYLFRNSSVVKIFSTLDQVNRDLKAKYGITLSLRNE